MIVKQSLNSGVAKQQARMTELFGGRTYAPRGQRKVSFGPPASDWTGKLKLEKGALPGYHAVKEGVPVASRTRHAALGKILKAGKDPLEIIRRLNVLANLNVNNPVTHQVFREDMQWVQKKRAQLMGGDIDDGVPPYGAGEDRDPRYVHPVNSDYRRHTGQIKGISRQQPRYSDGKTPDGYFEGAQNVRSGYRHSVHIGF